MIAQQANTVALKRKPPTLLGERGRLRDFASPGARL